MPPLNKLIAAPGERDLPVYGAALGGDGAIMLNHGEERDRVTRDGKLIGVKDAFAVEIYGDSMRPMFRPGNIAQVHPTRRPIPGEGVLIEFHNGHAEIKEYINQDDSVIRCRQYNPPQDLHYKPEDVKRLYLIVSHSLYG